MVGAYPHSTAFSSSSSPSSSTPPQLECPFSCGYRVSSADEYVLLLHIEAQHTDSSPFIPQEPPKASDEPKFDPLDYDFGDAADEENTYVMCPEDGCEEQVLLLELQNHMDLHSAEHLSIEGTPLSSAKRKAHGDDRRESHRSKKHEDDRRESHRSKKHEAQLVREARVSYYEPEKSQGSKGRSWMERMAFGIVPGSESGKLSKTPKGIAYTEGQHGVRPDLKKHSHADRSERKHRTRKHVKSGLGPYAHEKQMPEWLRRELASGAPLLQTQKIDPSTGRLYKSIQVANEVSGLIPTISLLIENDPNVVRAWVCHPAVKHVGKQIPKEGGFCGYRNIQMMISYVQVGFPAGTHPFEGRIPTILKIQDLIEAGWDRGINTIGREETGGIKGTRKYIGTSEAQTLFVSLGVPCHARAFGKSEGLETQYNLLRFVEDYFASGHTPSVTPGKVARTMKPPIYFQHSGHSMTIVGLERMANGTTNLLVFDPFFAPSVAMKKLIGSTQLKSKVIPEAYLKIHRRKMDYLQKYKEFEAIILG